MKYGCPTVKWMSLPIALCLFSVSTFLTRKTHAQNITQVTRCQSSKVATSERGTRLGAPTKGVNGVLVSDAVLVSDDKTFDHVELFINSRVRLSDGVLVNEGVLVSDGVVLRDVVLVSDEDLSADSVVQAVSAQTNDDPSRILFLQIDSRVDCSNY